MGYFTFKSIRYLYRIDGGLDVNLYIQILKDDFLGMLDYYNLDIEDIIYQQDNDPKHTVRVTKAWFRENNIKLLEWPP